MVPAVWAHGGQAIISAQPLAASHLHRAGQLSCCRHHSGPLVLACMQRASCQPRAGGAPRAAYTSCCLLLLGTSTAEQPEAEAPSLCLQAASAASRYLGQQLYRLDVWLEEKGVLGEITPATPKNVREGGVTQEELEVGFILQCPAWPLGALLTPHPPPLACCGCCCRWRRRQEAWWEAGPPCLFQRHQRPNTPAGPLQAVPCCRRPPVQGPGPSLAAPTPLQAVLQVLLRS